MVEVIWTQAALDDLYRIGDHIALDSPRYAREYTERLRATTDHLERVPGRGRMIPELEDPKLREVLLGNYRIMFLFEPPRVYVLAVHHARRRFPLRALRSRRNNAR